MFISHFIVFRGAQVEVKNKKGNSPLWLAANGGHLNVVELLYNAGADIDSQDNRKVLFFPHQKNVKYSPIYEHTFHIQLERTSVCSDILQGSSEEVNC
jgi:ankyrin repeat protein